MATFGYDTTLGWTAATYPKVLLVLQASYAAETTASVDVANGPPADLLRAFAGELTDVWTDAQGAYEASFINGAPGTGGVPGGAALENLLVDKIGPKVLAAKSSVVLPFYADPGPPINLPAGTAVRLEADDVLWTLDAPIVIPGGGTINGTCSYTETGPKTAIAGANWSIVNAISGWASVGPNVADAIPGRFAETDAEYRARYRAGLRDSTYQAISELPGVTSVSLNEWPWGSPDPEFGETHWVEYLVVGGDDAQIAQAIHTTRAKGVNTIGNTSTVVLDPNYIGGSYTERHSRPVLVACYVEATIIQGQGYPDDGSAEAKAAREEAIKKAVVAYFGSLAAGDSTSGHKVSVAISTGSGIAGMDDVEVKVDTVFPPVNTGTLTAGTREQFTIALIDIDVIGA